MGRFGKCAVVYMFRIKREGRVVCATCRQCVRIACIILVNKEGMVLHVYPRVASTFSRCIIFVVGYM